MMDYIPYSVVDASLDPLCPYSSCFEVAPDVLSELWSIDMLPIVIVYMWVRVMEVVDIVVLRLASARKVSTRHFIT